MAWLNVMVVLALFVLMVVAMAAIIMQNTRCGNVDEPLYAQIA